MTIEYQRGEPRNKRWGRRVRTAILAAGLVAWGLSLAWLINPLVGAVGGQGGLGAGVIGTPFMVFDRMEGHTGTYLADAGLLLGLVLVTQWLFLMPRGGWRIRLTTEGRRLKRAALGAGFAAMILSVGLLASILEVLDWWRAIYELWILWAIMLGVWGLWAVVFWVYWRSLDRCTAMSKTLRGLLAGSILEMLVAAPVQAWFYSEKDCYCARGSYTGLVFGGTAILWLFGPGLFLLWVREKERLGRTVQ